MFDKPRASVSFFCASSLVTCIAVSVCYYCTVYGETRRRRCHVSSIRSVRHDILSLSLFLIYILHFTVFVGMYFLKAMCCLI